MLRGQKLKATATALRTDVYATIQDDLIGRFIVIDLGSYLFSMTLAARLHSPTPAPGFSVELQSIRGLAALIVVAGHCFSVFELSGSPFAELKHALNGEGAVVFFFTLSGLVLSLQWAKLPSERWTYLVYLTRRFFRLYPLLIVTVLFGTVYCNYIHQPSTHLGTTPWFDSFYTEPISCSRFFLSLAGASARPAAPLWSIWVEIVGSILVPLFICCATRLSTKWFIGFGLLILSFLLENHTHYNFAVYLIDFYVGVTIVWWGRGFAERFRQCSPLLRVSTLVALFIIFFGARQWLHGTSISQINLIELTSTSCLVALIYHQGWSPCFLRHQALIWMGDISYSLYLLHFPLMYLLTQLLFSDQSGASNEGRTVVLVVATVGLSVAIASMTYKYIEKPFITLGRRRLESRLKRDPRRTLQGLVKVAK